MKPYVKIATDYAKAAKADTKGRKHGKWIRLAAERFLRDLERAKDKECSFLFDEWHACDPCDFIEKLPHVEGKWDSDTIELHPAQIFFIVQLFGFRNRATGARRFTSALYATARKSGKALALDTKLPTPDGWTTIGEVQPGDTVYGSDGKPTKVLWCSDVFVDHNCYELTFSNGQKVVADEGHLWKTDAKVNLVGGGGQGNKQTRKRIRTTGEIFESLRYGARNDLNHSVDMPQPLHCYEKELPIKPYTFGAWLGDGHSATARITFDEADSEILDGIKSDGYPVGKTYSNGSKAITYALADEVRTSESVANSLHKKLRLLGVLNNKHIPEIYLRSSFTQRLALLQGLMDTDGWCAKNGNGMEFVTTMPYLAEGFGELLSTFGIKYSLIEKKMRCNGKPVAGIAYSFKFNAFKDQIPMFRLSRKLDRMRNHADINIAARSKTVQIVDAVRVDSVPVKCIAVDNESKMFLFGETMLPTHNSTISAAILLYCQCCENEPGAQVLSAATTFPQAEIIFKVAKRMVEKTSDLREAFGLECWAKAISRMETGSSFKPIHAKASTQDGLNPSHVGLDEIHAHKTADLLNVLTSAAGARSNPLWLYTTTEGYTNPGPWAEIRLFVQKMLEGVFGDTADHFLACFWAIDDNDKEFDESSWGKANPLIDVNPHLLDAIRKEAVEAKQMPSKLAEFRIKRLNRQSATADGWVDLLRWQKCNGEVDLDWLVKYLCYGGLDLASTRDMCAFRLVWVVDGRTYTHGLRWVPKSAVDYRTERGTVPYAGWVASGLIKQTEGNTTDYAIIEQDIIDICEKFKVQQIAFDSWNASDLTNRLINAGIPLIEFIQGPKSYHPAMQQLERAYIQGLLNHGGDPVLSWCASNLVARRDQNLNMAPDKKKCADKIDDMVALLMAIGISMTPVDEDVDYNSWSPIIV